ncbi:hypothetical protein GCM10018793_41320 [Streptomyces sulfonofaciens]|uniref:PNPLA domain-containing protein n=1 Tax=Streptomyces sulfonofaciens TaxID=68272 RepID=A0A919GCW3_9ACTN|nr:patatin-like phospholipase family protein [Streptomyces sulfonofaciens]GHH82159.1 hypothetical protein GCM10018793_41320 [Streptomyces sulfonofaciens]
MRTLVLGGGGPVGAAWLGGLSEGLLHRRVDVRAATEILGTSAGAALGTWLSSGEPLSDFLDAMRDRALWHSRQSHGTDPALLARVGRTAGGGHPTEEEIRQVAQAAAKGIPPRAADEVAAEWAQWLPDTPWPRLLRMVCVDAATGRPRVWQQGDGLTPATGVATSTAAPGAVAPVLLGGRTWVDGGARSCTNVDLITSPPERAGRVLVLAPVVMPSLDVETALVRKTGAEVVTVVPDERSRASLAKGIRTMADPSATARAAEAGRAQAAAEADRLRDWWRTE